MANTTLLRNDPRSLAAIQPSLLLRHRRALPQLRLGNNSGRQPSHPHIRSRRPFLLGPLTFALRAHDFLPVMAPEQEPIQPPVRHVSAVSRVFLPNRTEKPVSPKVEHQER